jgi:hypothetical protein
VTSREATDYVSHIIRVPSRPRTVPSKARGQGNQHAAQMRSSSATFGGLRNQQLSISISSHTGPDLRYSLQYNIRAMEIIFVTDLTNGFKSGIFACMFQLLNASPFVILDIYLHNGFVMHTIEPSSMKFEIHTIKLFSCLSVVE